MSTNERVCTWQYYKKEMAYVVTYKDVEVRHFFGGSTIEKKEERNWSETGKIECLCMIGTNRSYYAYCDPSICPLYQMMKSLKK